MNRKKTGNEQQEWEYKLKAWCVKNGKEHTTEKETLEMIVRHCGTQMAAAKQLGTGYANFHRIYSKGKIKPEKRKHVRVRPMNIVSDCEEDLTLPMPENYHEVWTGSKSPCLECSLLHKTKNNLWCPECDRKKNYLKSIEDGIIGTNDNVVAGYAVSGLKGFVQLF